MIISSITGGLGNQMFQYAFGKAIAEKLNVPLLLDTTFYTSPINLTLEHPREFGLNVFNISAQIVNESELSRYICTDRRTLIKFLHKVKRAFSGNHLFKEKTPLCFDFNFKAIRDNTYVSGYWQTEKYFIEIRDILIKEFSLKKTLSEAVYNFEDQINSCNSVSLHIRRGDYTLESTKSFHGLLTMDYYAKALEILINKISSPVFFIFSDDPEWVLANFKIISNYQVISGDKISGPAEELHLMSKCKHNIVANSSFSWWGAWLNTGYDKKVIAPKSWIVNTPKDAEIVPESWIGI